MLTSSSVVALIRFSLSVSRRFNLSNSFTNRDSDPSAYPHVDPYHVFPQDIIAQLEKLASQAAAKAAAAAEMAATVRTMYSDFLVSRCVYPMLVVCQSILSDVFHFLIDKQIHLRTLMSTHITLILGIS